MDYSVGSLSDLITGSKTSNKRKVVKKKFAASEIAQPLKTTKIIKRKLQNKEESESPIKRIKKIIKPPRIQVTVESKQKDLKLQKRKNDNINPKQKADMKQSRNKVTASKNIEPKEKKSYDDPELLSRTIFVGNLPITLKIKECKQFFGKYGKVQTVRVRGVPVAKLKTPKRVAFIRKEFHPKRKSFYAFVRFAKREDAIKATESNGVLFQDHHLIVKLCGVTDKPDETKAIFVGNLSFYAEEDDLWKLFEPCGPISTVRIVRDNKTGVGKGFGYVNFESADSVTLALEMENVKLNNRELRIKICNINSTQGVKTNKGTKVQKPRTQVFGSKQTGIKKEQSGIQKLKKKQGTNTAAVSIKKESSDTKGHLLFQGIKFVQKKKKNTLNKGLLQKKRLVKKLAPKIKKENPN